MDRGASPLDAADLLRQLVYLPQASIFVAEAERHVVGGAVLALRPSVAPVGFVGTIDCWSSTPTTTSDRVTAALLEEVIRSASNKGCTVVEAVTPDDPDRRRTLDPPGIRPGRSAHPTTRGSGRQCRAPHVIIAPSSSVIAPAGASTRDPLGVNVGKNVAVFVDVANIFYAAKAAGVDIDYVTLLKAASAGRDLVRAYAYTGLDPDNENQRNFHDFLRRSNYKVVSKDIRKYGDGKIKANLDIELVVDMMKTARNLDIAIVVSGDGDFAPAIRAVQEQGVRVEVISFRGNTSSDLIEVADQFTDITQLARVEKGSRSGRRVADGRRPVDDRGPRQADRRHRARARSRGGRGRGRGRAGEAEPVAASPPGSRSRSKRPGRRGRQRERGRGRPSCPARRAPVEGGRQPDRGRPGRRRGVHPGRCRCAGGRRQCGPGAR